jgi:hypothetical protein
MDAKPSNATPTASQAWWLSRALAALPCGLIVGFEFSAARLRSLQSCVRRGWLDSSTLGGGWISVYAYGSTRDAFNRFLAAGK